MTGTYSPSPQEEKGGTQLVRTHDPEVLEVLQDILTELKRINIQLYSITNEEITEGDLE